MTTRAQPCRDMANRKLIASTAAAGSLAVVGAFAIASQPDDGAAGSPASAPTTVVTDVTRVEHRAARTSSPATRQGAPTPTAVGTPTARVAETAGQSGRYASDGDKDVEGREDDHEYEDD